MIYYDTDYDAAIAISRHTAIAAERHAVAWFSIFHAVVAR